MGYSVLSTMATNRRFPGARGEAAQCPDARPPASSWPVFSRTGWREMGNDAGPRNQRNQLRATRNLDHRVYAQRVSHAGPAWPRRPPRNFAQGTVGKFSGTNVGQDDIALSF